MEPGCQRPHSLPNVNSLSDIMININEDENTWVGDRGTPGGYFVMTDLTLDGNNACNYGIKFGSIHHLSCV